MRPLITARKLLILFAGVLAFGLMPMSASAITEEELKQEAMKEKMEDYGKRLDILERFRWGGDFRLRSETTSRSRYNAQDSEQTRPRIRFRLHGNYHMEDDLDIGFRFVTGDSGSTSSNETLDGSFNNKTFDIDRAFFTWSPGNFEVIGGKMAMPFMYSEVIWDDDVNPEGLTETYSRGMGDTQLKFVLGQYMVDEQSDAYDLILWAFQGQVHQKTSFGKFSAAVAYYVYDGLSNGIAPTVGRGTLGAGSEMEDLDLMIEWSDKLFGQKIKLFGERVENLGYIKTASNTAGGGDQTEAWQMGVKYGSSGKKLLDWDAKFIYRVTEANAVFDGLADSDFHGGNSNSRGYETGFGIGLTKGVKLAYTYMNTKQVVGSYDHRELHHIDFKFKF